MHQIKWHDVRGDRGNEPYDYSSKWEPISTEKVIDLIRRHSGPELLKWNLDGLKEGLVYKQKTFSIRRDPASVVQAPVKPLFSERMGIKKVLTNCDVLTEGLVKPKDPGASDVLGSYAYLLRKEKEHQERIHEWQGEQKLGERLMIISNPTIGLPVGVPADAQVVFEVKECEAWTEPDILERIQRYLDAAFLAGLTR